MYNPTEFAKTETTFFFLYNGSAQGPMGSADTPISIDSSATSSEWSTSGFYRVIQGVYDDHVVARADAIMTPTIPDDYSTFGFLRAQGNADRSYTNPISAWQDHPARASYHTTISDEALHIYADNTANLSFARVSGSSATANFTIAAEKAIIAGFLA
jgi:hypothetical protein